MNSYRKLRRCPVCHSKEIYKRVWSKIWSDKSNPNRFGKERADIFKKKSKKYRCINCKKEFDEPEIILQKE